MTNNIEVDTYDNTSGSTAGFIIKSNLLTVNGGKKEIPFDTMNIIKLNNWDAAPVNNPFSLPISPDDVQQTASTINEGDCVKDGADPDDLINLKIFRPQSCNVNWKGNGWKGKGHGTDEKLKVISTNICDKVFKDMSHKIAHHYTYRGSKAAPIPCSQHRLKQIVTGATTSNDQYIPLDMQIDEIMYDCGWINFTDPNIKIIGTPGSDLDPHTGGAPQDHWPQERTIFKEGFLKYIGFGNGNPKNQMEFNWVARRYPHWNFTLKYDNSSPLHVPANAWLSNIQLKNTDFNTYFKGNATKAGMINGMSNNDANNQSKTKYVLAKEWGDTLQWVFYLLYRICKPDKSCTLSTCDGIVRLQILKYKDPALPLIFFHADTNTVTEYQTANNLWKYKKLSYNKLLENIKESNQKVIDDIIYLCNMSAAEKIYKNKSTDSKVFIGTREEGYKKYYKYYFKMILHDMKKIQTELKNKTLYNIINSNEPTILTEYSNLLNDIDDNTITDSNSKTLTDNVLIKNKLIALINSYYEILPNKYELKQLFMKCYNTSLNKDVWIAGFSKLRYTSATGADSFTIGKGAAGGIWGSSIFYELQTAPEREDGLKFLIPKLNRGFVGLGEAYFDYFNDVEDYYKQGGSSKKRGRDEDDSNRFSKRINYDIVALALKSLNSEKSSYLQKNLGTDAPIANYTGTKFMHESLDALKFASKINLNLSLEGLLKLFEYIKSYPPTFNSAEDSLENFLMPDLSRIRNIDDEEKQFIKNLLVNNHRLMHYYDNTTTHEIYGMYIDVETDINPVLESVTSIADSWRQLAVDKTNTYYFPNDNSMQCIKKKAELCYDLIQKTIDIEAQWLAKMVNDPRTVVPPTPSPQINIYIIPHFQVYNIFERAIKYNQDIQSYLNVSKIDDNHLYKRFMDTLYVQRTGNKCGYIKMYNLPYEVTELQNELIHYIHNILYIDYFDNGDAYGNEATILKRLGLSLPNIDLHMDIEPGHLDTTRPLGTSGPVFSGGKLKTKKKYRKQKSKRKKNYNKIRHKSYKQQHHKRHSRQRVKKKTIKYR